jgi:6,7-dimethyl-8-ribityllumazine synthase
MQRENKEKGRIINGKKLKIAVAISRFNRDMTEKMLEGALQTLAVNGVKRDNIAVAWVPGSFELPLACQKIAATKKYNGIIAIGCVIKGDTDHHKYIAREVSRGIMDVMLKFSIPVGFGVITTNNIEQALARSYGENNKGAEAAQAVLEMISVF